MGSTAPPPPTTLPANTLFNMRVPMPIPRTQNAPFFNGRYLNDFTTRVKQHGENAGITDNDLLVKYLRDYSSDQVKDVLYYMDEFDTTKTTAPTWDKAVEALKTLYGSSDKPIEYTEEDLQTFCRENAARSSFTRVSEVEDFYRKYLAIGGNLKKDGTIGDIAYKNYFVQAIPKAMKEWFLLQVPDANKSRKSPPEVSASVAILKSRFDKDSLIYDFLGVEEDTQAKSVTFDEYGNRVTTSSLQQDLISDPVTVKPTTATQARVQRSENVMDEITKRLEALTLAVQGGAGMSQAPTRPQRCFICGQQCGPNGVHIPGPRHCPETNRLVAEKLITFNAQNNRYVMPNGDDLPRVPPGWNGGVASYLRNHSSGQANTMGVSSSSYDPPPHMRSTGAVGLVYDNNEVLRGNSFALESLPPAGVSSFSYHSDPVTRSGRDTKRFDPVEKQNRPRIPEKTPQASTPQEPKKVHFPPETHPYRPETQQTSNTPGNSQSFPPPTNPINTEQGWKASRPGNPRGGGKDSDVDMRDAKGKNSPSQPGQYHFSSKVQEQADPEKVFAGIGDMKVEVPLFQLLGMSPVLSKLFTESTKSKREYGPAKYSSNKQAEYSLSSHFMQEAREEEQMEMRALHGSWGEESENRRLYVDENDPRLEDFVFRCSNAVYEIPRKKLFAMTVGDLNLSVNGVEFSAMIDSGSELTVSGSHFPEMAKLPMDFDGMRWSLKGIHGGYEPLRGCVTDAPMRIGGHDFAHHVFVSKESIGKHDIILGQPFLQYFSARLDYDRDDHVKLYLWSEDNKRKGGRPTIMIAITNPEDERNASALRSRNSKSAYIEEVNEEDF